MLRLTLVCVSLILIAVCIPPSQTASTAETIQRLTTTSEETLNLNSSLSSDGTMVSFESSADLTESGAAASFHAFRTDSRAVSGFQEFARGRLTSSSLSANGQIIAFASTEDLVGENQDRNSEIYLFDGSIKQLTHTVPSNAGLRLSDGNFAPSISNEGTLITFGSNRFSDSQRFEVILLNVSSSAITHVPSNEPVTSKLSGDGSRVFVVTGNGETSDLFAYDIGTHTTRLLMEHVAALTLTSARAVSDDGNRIVYSGQTGSSQTQVFLYDIREGAARELTQLGTRSTDVPLNATISGDGKRVMFATRRRVTSASDGSVELYLIDIPTDKTEQITNAPSSATAEVISSLNFEGSKAIFNFPRVLSGPVSNPDFSNNSEIYIANLSRRPDFGTVKIANAATRDFNDPRIAAESIVAISGTNLSNRTDQAKMLQGELPLSIGGTRVRVEGREARLLYVSPTEVGFVVPADIQAGPANILVTNSEGFPSKCVASVARVAPGIFENDNQGIALDADTFKAEPFDPTDGQLRVILFGTGIRNASQLAVSVSGEQVPVESLLRSSLPGLDEIHLRLPAQLRGAGNVAISVTGDGLEANVVSTSLSGSVLREIMINEVLTDPPDGPAGDANHDGTRDSSGDEFVELVNPTSHDIDLTAYQLQSRTTAASSETLRHRFAAGTVIPAGSALVVFGGGTLDPTNRLFGGAQIIRASTSGLSLSNGGGVVTLRDANEEIVSSINYGPTAGVAGDANQSITRSPDVVGGLALHQSLNTSEGRPFSPGTRIDGSAFLPRPAVASIMISPTSVELIRGAQQQFSAKALDSEAHELDGVIFSWKSSGNSVLSIDSNGQAKAIGSGRSEVTAFARGTSSNVSIVTVATPTPTPTPIPTPTPTPTPTSTPTPLPSPTATPSPSPSPTPLASPTPLTQVVISEVRTRGPNGASDEFVELYNNSDSGIDMSGWKLKGSSGSGAVTNRLTMPAGTIVAPRQHLLLTNSNGYSGTVTGDLAFTSGFANDGGFAITLPNDIVVDQLGLSSGSAFGEGMHLAPLPSDANQSYERKPGGASGSTQDTNDNFSDFQLLTPSDPQNSSSEPTPGPSPTPSPSPSPTTNPTPTPGPSPGPSPSPSPSSTPSQSPSSTPTPAPSPSPSASPTVSPTPSPSLPPLVISEFRTRGPGGASDEFIELYNLSDNAIDAAGLKIRGSSSGGTITTKLIIPSNTLIPARGHFLATNSTGYSGTVVGDQSYTSGVANDGGVALTMSDDSIIDQVGLSAGSAFKEGMHLAPLSSDANQSYERKPGGASGSSQDSQDNFSDFQLLAPSDPQNLNSAPTPGASPSPSPSATPTPSPSPSPTSNSGVVISQIYGGGGNSGAPFRNDFIELFNAGSFPANLSGWSVQYASATASTWSVTALSSITLSPGQYYLVQEAGGANGSALPTPDMNGSINLASTAGKVALVKSTTALSGTCPSEPNIVDLIGYGTSANCFKGSAPATAPSNTNATLRTNGGCSNTNNNASDFTAAAPEPRNSATTFHVCLIAVAFSQSVQNFFEYQLKWVLLLEVSCRGSPLITSRADSRSQLQQSS